MHCDKYSILSLYFNAPLKYYGNLRIVYIAVMLIVMWCAYYGFVWSSYRFDVIVSIGHVASSNQSGHTEESGGCAGGQGAEGSQRSESEGKGGCRRRVAERGKAERREAEVRRKTERRTPERWRRGRKTQRNIAGFVAETGQVVHGTVWQR